MRSWAACWRSIQACPFRHPGNCWLPTPSCSALRLSAAKLATIRGIAQATVEGVVPNLEEARCLPDAALIERLVSLRGVGRWTVEMFLIYSLERSDILPVDDFGVREGYARLKGLEKHPRRARCATSARRGARFGRWPPGICGDCPAVEYRPQESECLR